MIYYPNYYYIDTGCLIILSVLFVLFAIVLHASPDAAKGLCKVLLIFLCIYWLAMSLHLIT